MRWSKIFRRLLPDKNKKKINKIKEIEDFNISERENFVAEMKFVSCLEDNLAAIRELYGDSFDLNIRRFKAGKEKLSAALVHMSGLTDSRAVEKILETIEKDLLKIESLQDEDIYHTVKERLLDNKGLKVTGDLSQMLTSISQGLSAILFEGVGEVILCETKGFQIRNIQEPDSEIVIRGPRDGFVENIFTNTSLIRQRIRVPHLWLQNLDIGSLSRTNVALAYIKGLASEELVDEIKQRLSKIDIDAILESGYIQEYIKDEALSIFPLTKRTERPDVVAASLLEGRVALFTDGTPFVLILPVNLALFLQAPDDYYESFPIGSFIRSLRYLGFITSIFLPGTYVAIINYHSELLPASLLLRIAATREGVPFPVIIEALFMAVVFEILREAGVRLPQAIGSAISIVGALVLGQAAIDAGLASPAMIIIVALTAISSFTIPDYTLQISARLLRFFFLILGAVNGLFGIQFGAILLLIHLAGLRSFGQPYFQPFAPLIWEDMKDNILRFPWWSLITRPKLVGGREPGRQKKGQEPRPPITRKKGEQEREGTEKMERRKEDSEE